MTTAYTKYEYQIMAMECIFKLCELITEGELTIADLQEIMSQAVGGGWDMLQINLAMVSLAAQEAEKGSQS